MNVVVELHGLARLLTLVLASVLGIPQAGAADAAASAPTNAGSILRGEGLDRPVRPPTQSASDPMFPQRVDMETDPAIRAAYQDALLAYYRYRQSGLEHRQRVFAWQHVSSITIFVVVVLLVACGIYFAALQFHRDLPLRAARQRGAPAAAATSAATPSAVPPPAGTKSTETSSVEISAAGVKVSSPVLGVVILVISLAFFYLYLAFVYPIREVF